MLGGCQLAATTRSQIEVPLYQKWGLQPGDAIAGYTVAGGLGDTSIFLNGNAVYAPYDGDTFVDGRGCLYFSTPTIPAYLFRFCGLRSPTTGSLRQGQSLGRATIVQFAALLKQDKTWAIVEPDKAFLERTLKP
ncbi:hypothetical protein [Myxacorys almedinensis]|uniref:Uncharacterized protein n=1 Tax=Myxacorys almedinensis A TaxID=2690445 RepID=A0A8J7Z6X3_9CYAN|nr:hypothetical protein [Myxacorys almedinensis]NDJ19031.1 hypothetical protein [Myxacorys almedinensis A]